MVALVFELAEMVVRQEKALNHIVDHVDPSQDKEIEMLKERLEKLEKGTKPKPKTPRGKE